MSRRKTLDKNDVKIRPTQKEWCHECCDLATHEVWLKFRAGQTEQKVGYVYCRECASYLVDAIKQSIG